MEMEAYMQVSLWQIYLMVKDSCSLSTRTATEAYFMREDVKAKESTTSAKEQSSKVSGTTTQK